MRLVEVIPIARGISYEVLSYFTTEDIPLGSLVEIDVRKRKIKGLVVGSEDAVEAKGKIRSADFTVKKIKRLEQDVLIPSGFIRAARITADYFAATTGAVLNILIPKFVLENQKLIDGAGSVQGHSLPAPSDPSLSAEISVLQDSDEHRFSSYKSLIRESFARKKSIFIMVPTHEGGLELKEKLEKGIESRIVFLTSAVSKKKLSESWQKLKTESHPLLIIGTGSFLSALRPDVKTILVDNESSPSYKIFVRPFLDFRYFVEVLAKEIGARLILSDQYLRIETLHRFYEGDIAELSPLKFRPENNIEEKLIDMKNYRQASGTSFQVLSDEVGSIIQKLPKKGERLFIFSARRGLSPTTICSDCGTVVTCRNCGAPVVLHKSKKTEKENFFLCHHCGERRSALEKCVSCGSWRLSALGIGIEKVEEEIKKKFPDTPLYRLDKESGSTPKKARDIVKKFYDTPGSILLGTEMAFLYHREPVEYGAIASMDSIFSVPDFHINERIFHILLLIKSQTTKEFLIQTRNPEQPALLKFIQGRFAEFYREEIESRRQFGYPPFKVLIKISLEGKKAKVSGEMAELEKIFQEYQPFTFPAFVGTSRGEFALHSLIKIDSQNYPNEDLVRKLLSLPPNYTVRVNPESLL